MKSFLFILAILLYINSSCSEFPKNKKNPAITEEEIKSHIEYLASDELKGRYSGSKELVIASEYIMNEFSDYGLKPLFDGNFVQEFPFTYGVDFTANNSVILEINGNKNELIQNQDFVTSPFSGSGKESGKLVFAGYGISAPELNYDDYSGIDVNHKIVVVMRHHPDIDNPHNEFEKYSDLRYKSKTAQEKGAVGIIYINGYLPEDGDDTFINIHYNGARGMGSFPAVHIKRVFAEKLFKIAGVDFKEHQKTINENNKPASFSFKKSNASIQTEVKQVEKTTLNVAGFLEGNDPSLKDEYIVIGAHYDHVGMGETGSLYRGTIPQIHNGADDNASGTTGVLELAEKFASIKDQLKRSIIFITFSGEELGLFGSNYFVNNSPVPIENIVTMVNMDMIGRMDNDNNLTVHGAGTSNLWKSLLNKFNDDYNYKITFEDAGYGPSDHSSFYGKGIPVLFFFTGLHQDYHRPTDDAEKINTAKQESLLKYIYEIVEFINKETNRPDYVSIPRQGTGVSMRSSVYVGTIPDYSAQVNGFKITGVSEESPAQKAGLLGGDIIVEFGGKKITNIYDYMYAMNDFAPGDVVEVIVIRGGKKVNLKVELAAR